jgi:hypothetical protein
MPLCTWGSLRHETPNSVCAGWLVIAFHSSPRPDRPDHNLEIYTPQRWITRLTNYGPAAGGPAAALSGSQPPKY